MWSHRRDCAPEKSKDPRQTKSVTLLRCQNDAEGWTYRLGSYTPFFLRTSATMGTVELTGLEMTSTKALGECSAMPTAMSRTMPALICESDRYDVRAKDGGYVSPIEERSRRRRGCSRANSAGEEMRAVVGARNCERICWVA